MGFAYEPVIEDPTMVEVELTTIPLQTVDAKQVWTGVPATAPVEYRFVTVVGPDGRLHQVPRELLPVEMGGGMPAPTVVVADSCSNPQCAKQARLAALAVFLSGFCFTPLWCLGWAFVKHPNKCVRRLGKASLWCVGLQWLFVAIFLAGTWHQAREHHHGHGHGLHHGFQGRFPDIPEPERALPCPALPTQDECFASVDARRRGCGWCTVSQTCSKGFECQLDGDNGNASWLPNPVWSQYRHDDGDDGDDHHRGHHGWHHGGEKPRDTHNEDHHHREHEKRN